MSPDEGLSDGERIKLWAWATLSQTPEAKLVLKLDGRLTMAEGLLAHRASGEGGSTSALRASAPEAFDADPLPLRLLRRAKAAEAEVAALREAASGAFRWFEERNFSIGVPAWDVMRGLRTALAPPQADAKAIPSSASPPPPPEGISDAMLDAACAAYFGAADRPLARQREWMRQAITAALAVAALSPAPGGSA